MSSAVAIFLLGLVVLVIGAEVVVRGSVRLALSLGVSPLVLGLTIVSVGTSAPELAVGITASLEGAPAIAVANIAGTNVINLLLILGLTALIRPVPLHLRILKLELPTIVLAAALMTLLAWDDGVLTTSDGLVLLLAGVGYTVVLVRESRKEGKLARAEFEEEYAEETTAPGGSVGWLRVLYGVLVVVGIALSILGADLLVRGAVDMARSWNLSEAFIGLTIVAIGTSAPELATTIVATIRNERDVAVGNLIGSSIYNILFILGITCVVLPGDLPVDPDLLTFDIPLMAGAALLCVPVFISGRRVSRLEGALFVGIYGAYLAYLLATRGAF